MTGFLSHIRAISSISAPALTRSLLGRMSIAKNGKNVCVNIDENCIIISATVLQVRRLAAGFPVIDAPWGSPSQTQDLRMGLQAPSRRFLWMSHRLGPETHIPTAPLHAHPVRGRLQRWHPTGCPLDISIALAALNSGNGSPCVLCLCLLPQILTVTGLGQHGKNTCACIFLKPARATSQSLPVLVVVRVLVDVFTALHKGFCCGTLAPCSLQPCIGGERIYKTAWLPTLRPYGHMSLARVRTFRVS